MANQCRGCTLYIEIDKDTYEIIKLRIEKYIEKNKSDNDELLSNKLDEGEFFYKQISNPFLYDSYGLVKVENKYYIYFHDNNNYIEYLRPIFENTFNKIMINNLNLENAEIVKINEISFNTLYNFVHRVFNEKINGKISLEKTNLFDYIALFTIEYYNKVYYIKDNLNSFDDSIVAYYSIVNNIIKMIYILDVKNSDFELIKKLSNFENDQSDTSNLSIYKEILMRYKNYINVKDELKNNILTQYSINFDDIVNNLDVYYDDEKITISFKGEFISNKNPKDINNLVKDKHFLTILDVQKIFKYYNIKINFNDISFVEDFILTDLEKAIIEKLLLNIYNEKEKNKEINAEKVVQSDVKTFLHTIISLNSVYKYSDLEDLIYYIKKRIRSEELKNIFIIADVVFDKLYFIYTSYLTKLLFKSPKKLLRFFEDKEIIVEKYVISKTNNKKETNTFNIFVIDMRKLCEVLNINFNELYDHLKNNAPDIKDAIENKKIIVNEDEQKNIQ